MSNYIMHSSGTWKNHKWIRREGSPGNYKYYYKSSDSDSSGSSKKYTDDPDYNPSTPYTNQYKDKNGKKHGMSTGSGTADTVRDTAYGTAGKSNYYGNKKLDSKKRARDIAELKRRSMGEAYRNEMVNRMIDAMSGKTVTDIVNAPSKKANRRRNMYEKPEYESLYSDYRAPEINYGPTRVGKKGSLTKYINYYYSTPNAKKRNASDYFNSLRTKVRDERAAKRASNRATKR